MAPDRWLQIEFTVASDALEAVEAALDALGALSVSLADAGAAPVLEPAPGTTPLWPEVTVTALLPADTAEDAIRLRLAALPAALIGDLRCTSIVERDWVREFREHLEPRHFGRRLWICPQGMPCPDPDGAIVTLEPGLAFGTGSHPSTAMCLQWIAELDLDGRTLLDWGCGSGILAIAALVLGAASAAALDIDPQALQATRENARDNAVDARLQVTDPARFTPTQRFDVLVANILADTLVALAPVLAAHCRTGAAVALSGILTAQAAGVIAATRPWFDLHPVADISGWVLLAGTRIETRSASGSR